MSTLPFPPLVVASSSDSLIVASGSAVHIHSVASSSSLSALDKPTAQSHAASLIRFVAISTSESHLATVTDSKQLRIYSLNPLTLLSTRQITKKCSDISFTPNDDILISDRVGDVYLYPFEPRSIPADTRPTVTELNSDPSKNPDADLILGHVSVISSHALTQDGKYIITADRDEHIRVSRYPQSYVIERYLFGADGFVSALHIPESRPELLISGGGENLLRIWDWSAGKQVGGISIWEAILPHRRVRSAMRKTRRPAKRAKLDSSLAGDPAFYQAPEGWLLPSGEGVCIKKIRSVTIGSETIVVFFSEGAAAVHAFTLDPSGSPTIHTLPLPSPVLDFASIPGNADQILLTLDRSWGVLKQNQVGDEKHQLPSSLDEAQIQGLNQPFITAQIGPGGIITDISSTSLVHPAIQSQLSSPDLLAPISTISNLNLYSNLSLMPRWPGMEEDDDLAGTNDTPTSVATSNPAAAEGSNPVTRIPASEIGVTPNKQWTREELEQLGPRQLGRLKSQGVDVGDLLLKRKKELKQKKRAAREAANGGGKADGEGEKGEGLVEMGDDVDEEQVAAGELGS